MKHTFSYNTAGTSPRNTFANLFCIGVVIFSYYARSSVGDKTIFVWSIGMFIAFIIFYQISVYREGRRYEKSLSNQKVTEEAR